MLSHKFIADALALSARAFSSAAATRFEEQYPEYKSLSLPGLFKSPRSDVESRLLQISAAILVEEPDLIVNAVAWYRAVFFHRQVPDAYLRQSYEVLAQVLASELPDGARVLVAKFMDRAIACAKLAPAVMPSVLAEPEQYANDARHFLLSVLEDRISDAIVQIRRLLDGGMAIADIHDHILVPVQREVGRMWLAGEVPIGDEHQCSLAVGRVLDLLQDRIPSAKPGALRVLAFSVGGNLHDLGIRVVSQRMQLAGYSVTNLGGNLPTSDMAFLFADRPFELLAVSEARLTDLPEVMLLVENVRHVHSKQIKILLGGQMFGSVPNLHARLGADGGIADAGGVVEAVQSLIGS